MLHLLLLLVSLLLLMSLLIVMVEEVVVVFPDAVYSVHSFIQIHALAFPKYVVVVSQGPVALVTLNIMQQPAMSTQLSLMSKVCVCA